MISDNMQHLLSVYFWHSEIVEKKRLSNFDFLLWNVFIMVHNHLNEHPACILGDFTQHSNFMCCSVEVISVTLFCYGNENL